MGQLWSKHCCQVFSSSVKVLFIVLTTVAVFHSPVSGEVCTQIMYVSHINVYVSAYLCISVIRPDLFVCLGFRLRSTTTPWKSEMAPQPPPLWLVNTTAPKLLIFWFPPPTSCSCCSPLTTAALQQASASDTKVRRADSNCAVFIQHFLHIKLKCVTFLTVCVTLRCENGVRLLSRPWNPSQWSPPWEHLLYWLSSLVYLRRRIYTEWLWANRLWSESSVESCSAQLRWWDIFSSLLSPQFFMCMSLFSILSFLSTFLSALFSFFATPFNARQHHKTRETNFVLWSSTDC